MQRGGGLGLGLGTRPLLLLATAGSGTGQRASRSFCRPLLVSTLCSLLSAPSSLLV